MLDFILIIVALAVLWVAVRYLARFLTWVERSEIARQKAEAEAERRRTSPSAPSKAAPAAPEGVPADHIVAIAAAVATYGLRVVHITDASGHAWASEGRWQHQTSHRPH